MTDQDWSFWLAQLAGESPETTPGEPHAGYYKGGSAGTQYKRKFPDSYIAIWKDENGEWIARTHQAGKVWDTRGYDVDERVFPRCCRNAIEYEDYLKGIGNEPDDNE